MKTTKQLSAGTCMKTALEWQKDAHIAAFVSTMHCKDKEAERAAHRSCKAVVQAQLWYEQVNLH